MQYVLVGDIGGTKTVLSLCAHELRASYREVASARFVSREYSGLAPMTREFLREALRDGSLRDVRAAVFGAAGPVERGVIKTTNLPWVIDQRVLSDALSAPVSLVNDFHAVALGIAELAPADFAVLQEGQVEPEGITAVLGAGTGLGEALVLPTVTGPKVVPSEGGHVDFAPRSPLEVDLLRFMWQRHRRVSVERLVSGPGLRALYDFVTQTGLVPAAAEVSAKIAAGDAGQVIGELGVNDTDPACSRALDMFVSLYGSEAGNLALKVLPRAGVYLAGGIAPKVIEKLKGGSFMHAFLDKGRLSSALQTMRVAVIMNPKVALYGARRLASQLALTRS